MNTNSTGGGGFLFMLTRPCARSGGLPDCHLNYTTTEADPDIAGIGVISSFVITCCISSILVPLSYVVMHQENMKRNFVDNFLFPFLPTKLKTEPETRDYYAKIIVPLVLGLADQQVVTGLAVLLAGFIKCDISVYHFNIVADLGWLSSMTQLNSVIVLREFLQERRAARMWWYFAMSSITILLILTMIVQGNEYWSDYKASPMECLNLQGDFSKTSASWIAFWIIATVWNHAEMALLLFPNVGKSIGHTAHPVKRQLHTLGVFLGWLFPPSRSILMAFPRVGRRLIEFISSYVVNTLTTTVWLGFSIGFLFADREARHDVMTVESISEESQWGFGQLVPMFLILLCFVNILEIWSGRAYFPTLPPVLYSFFCRCPS